MSVLTVLDCLMTLRATSNLISSEEVSCTRGKAISIGEILSGQCYFGGSVGWGDKKGIQNIRNNEQGRK